MVLRFPHTIPSLGGVYHTNTNSYHTIPNTGSIGQLHVKAKCTPFVSHGDFDVQATSRERRMVNEKFEDPKLLDVYEKHGDYILELDNQNRNTPALAF
jgi:hypothetical protein